MPKQKIIFFPDPLVDETNLLMKELKEHMLCYKSSNADEFEQIFKQSGKFVVVFSTVSYAVKFFEKNADTLSKLKFKSYCFRRENETLTDQVQGFLKNNKVSLFGSGKTKDLQKDIGLFFEELVFEN